MKVRNDLIKGDWESTEKVGVYFFRISLGLTDIITASAHAP